MLDSRVGRRVSRQRDNKKTQPLLFWALLRSGELIGVVGVPAIGAIVADTDPNFSGYVQLSPNRPTTGTPESLTLPPCSGITRDIVTAKLAVQLIARDLRVLVLLICGGPLS